MTINDNTSVYVGGLPYDVTEESLRRIFDIYGAVVAVKIINDRSIGGKCYGFVTFRNPRSAMHAIKEMDGRTIDGRVVRVNEVKTRGGRSNFNRESVRRDSDRGIDRDRVRYLERDQSYDTYRYRDGRRERSQDSDQDRERGYDRVHGHDRARDRYVDGDRFHERNRQMADEQELERKNDQDRERDRDHSIEERRNNSHHNIEDNDNYEQLHLLNGSSIDGHGHREFSLESDGDDHNQVENKLASASEELEELHNKISRMEEVAAEKEEFISKLREKSQKLEDSLLAAKKTSLYHRLQLTKLHKCYLQVKDYDDRLKTSEQEFQMLIDKTRMDLEHGDRVGVTDESP
ncbi:U1 small nuclear ribonucleo 70 kDa [Olea europaea subsp. europaea]|uniref:U1 small nuclear ribonucleo 70 kDa n=2 Tax=Olea europaea subsp. europaea TaxID=158383 RepID=A0A8S0TSZ9_OLEEU|nr:U1 small nuclear ribonucleo 70 kDa [Olea europaea subsp. europaea]